MKHYEYTYLTRADMPEDEAKKLQDALITSITAKKGVIVDLPRAYKKRLAYPVKKQNAAYVNTILFQVESPDIVGFKKETDEMSEIMRGLIVFYNPENFKREARRERPQAAEKTIKTELEATVETAESKEKPEIQKEKPAKEKPAKPERKTKIKAELRDIEQKLDEILK